MKVNGRSGSAVLMVAALAVFSACASKEVRVEAPKKQAASKPVIEQIQDRLRSRNTAIAKCYEKNVDTTLKKGEKAKPAELMTKFAIGADGKVTSARITQSSLNNKKAEACILDVIKSTPFPKPESPAGLEITYPVKLTPEVAAAPGVGK